MPGTAKVRGFSLTWTCFFFSNVKFCRPIVCLLICCQLSCHILLLFFSIQIFLMVFSVFDLCLHCNFFFYLDFIFPFFCFAKKIHRPQLYRPIFSSA